MSNFGIERIRLSAFFAALAVVLVIVLEVLVPYDTALQSPGVALASFVVTAVATCAGLLSVVIYSLLEAARAERDSWRAMNVMIQERRCG